MIETFGLWHSFQREHFYRNWYAKEFPWFYQDGIICFLACGSIYLLVLSVFATLAPNIFPLWLFEVYIDSCITKLYDFSVKPLKPFYKSKTWIKFLKLLSDTTLLSNLAVSLQARSKLQMHEFHFPKRTLAHKKTVFKVLSFQSS